MSLDRTRFVWSRIAGRQFATSSKQSQSSPPARGVLYVLLSREDQAGGRSSRARAHRHRFAPGAGRKAGDSQGSLSYHNTGKTEIDIAADAVNVWGVRYGLRDKLHVFSGAGVHVYSVTMPEVSRRLIASVVELREAARGGRAGFNNVIEPGATTTLSDVIVLRRAQYDLIDAQLVAVPVKLHRAKVRVDLISDKGGGTSLRPDPTRAFEDDNTTDFALIP